MLMMHSKDLEFAILGAMILDDTARKSVFGVVDADDFHYAPCKAAFEAISALAQKGYVDLVMLKAEMTARGTFDTMGGDSLMQLIAQSTSTTVNAKHHAMEVRRLAEARHIHKGLADLSQKQSGITAADVRELADRAENNRYVNNYADAAMDSISRFKAGLRTQHQRIKTGLTSLDKTTGGLRLGTVCTIGAYPSTGKTALALNFAAKQEGAVVVFSLEMTAEMIYERLASAEEGLDYGIFNHRRFTDKQLATLDDFADRLQYRRLHVFDDMWYVEQHADIAASIKPSIMIVDFVQKVNTHKKTEGRRLDVEHISGMYKRIAKENNCLVMLLSQFSRPPAGTKNARPTMQSLKESGALEADSDVVMLLYRPHVLDKGNPDIKPQDGDVEVAKNKFGLTSRIDLVFNGEHQTFREPDFVLYSKQNRPW